MLKYDYIYSISTIGYKSVIKIRSYQNLCRNGEISEEHTVTSIQSPASHAEAFYRFSWSQILIPWHIISDSDTIVMLFLYF